MPLLFVGYIASAVVGTLLTRTTSGLAVLWFANGILAAGLLLLKDRRALIFFLVCGVGSLVRTIISDGFAPSGLITCVTDLCEAWLIARLVRRSCGAALDVSDPKRFRAMALQAILPASLLSGSMGSVLVSTISKTRFDELWLHWCAGDVLGNLIVVPAILLIARPDRFARSRLAWRPIAAFVVTLAVLTAVLFAQPQPVFLALMFPALIIAAFVLAPAHMAWVGIAIALIASAMTLSGWGPIAAGGAGASMGERVLLLQLYVAAAFFSGLITSGALAQRRRARARLTRAFKAARRASHRTQKLMRDLRTAHDEAVARESFFDSIVHLLPTLLMVKNAADGRYILVNKAAEESLGVQAAEMIGKSVYDMFPKAEADKFTAEDRQVIRSRKVKIETEELITTRCNGARYFTTKKFATFGPEGARHIVSLADDVTERRTAAEQLRTAVITAEDANRAKGEFLANMSHEIRTPLNGVVGMADLLAKSNLSERDREMVSIIKSSGETLERLLSDMLDLARIESGEVVIETAPFHLGETIRAVAALSKLKADEKGIELRIDVDADSDRTFTGDAVRVRQVVTNLVSNAVKFTDLGAVSITARFVEGRVSLSVADTGCGFDPANKEKVFGRFQQADGSITRRFGGTGLGLSISRHLVDLMGGSLDCDSAPGEGSVFRLDLPLEPFEGSLDVEETGADQGECRAMRILVADDHPTNRKVVDLILADVGCDLVFVENGQEALDAFNASAFDIVLMDMQMPIMDGLTAVRLIRAQEAEGGVLRTPILMLTANALAEHVEAGRRAGADGHVTKPINAHGLLTAIVEAVRSGEERTMAAA